MEGISLVIPSNGKSVVMEIILSSIARQKFHLPTEVILVLNGLEIEPERERLTSQWVAPLGLMLRIELLAKPGVNRSRNRGLQNSKYETVFFLDDDCELDDSYLLEKHFLIHNQNPQLLAVGGVYSLSKKASFFSRLYQEVQMQWLHRGLKYEHPQREASYLIGGHFSVKKKMLIENGISFDEEITYGGSELSFFAKTQEKNFKLELHDFSVLHHTQETFFSLHRKFFRQGQGKARLKNSFETGLSDASIKSEKQQGPVRKITFIYFGWIFWFGYYYQKKNKLGFLFYLLRVAVNFVIFVRGKSLERISKLIEIKKKRGDRF